MTAIALTGITFVDATYEIEEDAAHNKRHLHYLGGGDGLFAIYTLDEKGGSMYYLHTDYQGSYETITNAQGAVVEKLSYDPWGRRRNPTSWTFTDVPEDFLFDRGYTGHEHLDQFGLINMNGRMYDPVVARFLSPDPLIQFPENSQSYNSYSYVLNNPLRFTDPSGFMVDWFINELSGDVYYNSAYKKGDETKIEGEGWTHFAENGKLSEKSSDVFALLWSNKELWDSYEQKSEESYNSKGEKVSSFGVEVMFKGNNAKEFMSRQGYDLVPTQQTIYENESSSYFPTSHGKGITIISGAETRITEKSGYIKKDNMEIGKYSLTRTMSNTNVLSLKKVSRYQITYTSNSWKKFTTRAINLSKSMSGTHDYRMKKTYGNWNVYPGNNSLINFFKEKYGTE
ncbi:RHS repeat domain-containing protein [Mariniphaga sediminis]|uniref:RHS repeat domain-containing protein n=1 Tax=Mariniphaga sediminis TaxID=1628158 RepID=UPI0035685349